MMDGFNLTSAAVAAAVIGIVAALTTMISRRGSNFVPSRPPSRSAVLITGGSRGIGRAVADHLLARGYVVLVTVRKQSQYDELEGERRKADGEKKNDEKVLIPVLMDVTDDAHVGPAVERVKSVLAEREEKTDLVAVVNNAGINPEADVMAKIYAEDKVPPNKLSDPSVASRILETNVVGVARVTRAFLPLLLRRGEGGGGAGGRIVNVGSYFGSIAGQVGMAHSYYEASKFALEGLSDSLRRSLRSEGIYVSLVKPGNISTDMNSYGEDGPEVVARDIEHAVGAPHPLPRYYAGKVKGYPVRMLCWVFEMLPTWLVDKI